MSNTDAATVGAGIEALIQKLGALDDSPAKAQAQELARLLMSLYGEGLSRVLDIVRTERGGPQAVLDRLASEPLLASLFVLHELHPHPVDVRVERALARLQPHLPAFTRVTLVAVHHDSVRVTVERATADQCQSGGTVRLAIERAIQEAAPEIAAVHIEGLGDPPSPSAPRSSGSAEARPLIQIARSSPPAAAP